MLPKVALVAGRDLRFKSPWLTPRNRKGRPYFRKDSLFCFLKNGVTDWNKVEPIFIEFSVMIPPFSRLNINDPNSPRSKDKLPITKQNLGELVWECIEVKKMSFLDTVLYLGVSSTTVRRICRTLKIGRYRDQIPGEIRANSSQVPFGWNSVNRFLEKNPGEWHCVEMMIKFREAGKSLHWIANELTRLGVKTKNGGKWYAKTVSQILTFNRIHLS